MSSEQDRTGSNPLFSIFLLSLYTLGLLPYTLNRLFGQGSSEAEVIKPWASKAKQELPIVRKLRKVATWRLLLAWAIWAALIWYIRSSLTAVNQFDPFEILKLQHDATDQEIKKAYRRLSLQFHPDKNPSPDAAEYFAQFVTKAYKALTDEVSRQNYAKYGHPDGPQAMSMSVALPEWFFSKDKKAAPLILLVLLLGGIVVPLASAAWCLNRKDQFVGPNQLKPGTLMLFAHPVYGVKEFHSLPKVPDTLVCATEFIELPMLPDQSAAMGDLYKAVCRVHPEIKDKPLFLRRKPSVVKVHLLLLAHVSRMEIPAPLAKDLSYLLLKAPGMLQEMFNISIYPRIPPRYGWLAPALACVEMSQCLVQAVPLWAKKTSPPGKSSDGVGVLLQLPHFSADVLRKLARKKIKVLHDLLILSADDRREVLQSAGLQPCDVGDVETALRSMPAVHLTTSISVEGQEASAEGPVIIPGDIVACSMRILLTRGRHADKDFDAASIKGTSVQAYAPSYPGTKEEQWYFCLGDSGQNAIMSSACTALVQAEAHGAASLVSWIADQPPSPDFNPLALRGFDPFSAKPVALGVETAEDVGQSVVLRFVAPLKPGKYDLVLYCMPDSWVGCDYMQTLQIKVVEPSAANRSLVHQADLQRSAESELLGSEGGEESDEESDAAAGSEGEYDSDEYGTEESEEEEG